MAADQPLEKSSMDSKEDALVIGKTDADGEIVLINSDRPRLMIFDTRDRNIATVTGDIAELLVDQIINVDDPFALSGATPTERLTELVHAALGAGIWNDDVAELTLGAELSTGRVSMYFEGARYTLTVEADHA